jgi:hypothetical protein
MMFIFKNSYLLTRNLMAGFALFTLLLVSLPGYAGNDNYPFMQAKFRLRQTLHIEVAEDHTRFSFDEAPVFEDGSPKAGNQFIAHGYIYEKGFFDQYSEGVDEKGQPIRPDLVIGEWTCRGVFVGNGMFTKTGPWVISTQNFDFYDFTGYHENQNRQFGKRMITTEGYELVDIDKVVKRAITGGTGRYNVTRGEHRQSSLGLGQFIGIRAKHTLKMRRF